MIFKHCDRKKKNKCSALTALTPRLPHPASPCLAALTLRPHTRRPASCAPHNRQGRPCCRHHSVLDFLASGRVLLSSWRPSSGLANVRAPSLDTARACSGAPARRLPPPCIPGRPRAAPKAFFLARKRSGGVGRPSTPLAVGGQASVRARWPVSRHLVRRPPLPVQGRTLSHPLLEDGDHVGSTRPPPSPVH